MKIDYSNLSNEELFRLHQNADKLALEALYVNNTDLAWFLARKYSNSYIELEELYAEAIIGLGKAVKNYNSDKGNKFSTFAGRCMTNEILMCLRKNKKHVIEVCRLQDVSHTNKEGKPIYYEELIADDTATEDSILDFIQVEEIKHMINKLPESHRKLMHIRYIDGMSQKEACAILGLAQSWISRKERGIISKLKEAIAI